MKTRAAFCGLLLLAAPTLAQDWAPEIEKPRAYANEGLLGEAGAVLGLGGPYAYGAELTLYPHRRVNLNAGFGVAPAGLKYGGGLKVFLRPESRISPFAGVNYSFSTGWPTITIQESEDEGGDETRFRVLPGQTVVPRVGVRYAMRRFANFYGTVGYGISTTGGQVKYRQRDAGDAPDLLFEPDGLELSLTASWRFFR